MHHSQPRIRRFLFAAALPVVTGLLGRADAAAPRRVVAPVPTITAFPLNTPPINGFVPRVVFGLTDEKSDDDTDFFAAPQAPPDGAALPFADPDSDGPEYFVATLDSGSQSHIIHYNTEAVLDLASAGRAGSQQVEILGAAGSEFATVSDPLGVYVTGFANATGGADIDLSPSVLIGQTNTAILSTDSPTSELPNIIGAPIVAQYQTVIRTSVPRQLTVGTKTYHTPDVSFQALNTPLPGNYSRLTLDVASPNGVSPTPAYFPSFIDIFDFSQDPAAPTFWMSMFADVDVAGAGGSVDDRRFLFDTGAQVTVLSQDTAAEVGYYSAGENPSTPDFFVDISGVGGGQLAPGFYLQQLKVMTNGGPIVWTNVPVVVLDVIDPSDGVGFVPGVLGMNLFTDRDLILNGGLTNPSVGISPQQQWATNASGNWSDATKWVSNSVPNTPDRPANFLGKITSSQTVNVNGNFTVGSLNFANANRYTLAGGGRITLQSLEGASGIVVASGSHTISALMTFASDTAIHIGPAGSKLTISSDVTATGVTISKSGAGTVEMKNVRAGELDVTAGTVAILPLGAATSVSVISDLSVTATGKLDLKNNNLIVKTTPIGSWNGSEYTGVTGMIQSGRNEGTWDGGGLVTSQTAATTTVLTTLAVATASDLGVGGSTWSGQSVANSNVLVMYTWGGDANLDGTLTGDDYFAIDSNILLSGVVFGFTKGDFNYDGLINGDDYFIIDSNIIVAQNSAPFYSGAGAGLDAVPEPASAALLCFTAALALRRRKGEPRS